jgi:hypothetical protein
VNEPGKGEGAVTGPAIAVPILTRPMRPVYLYSKEAIRIFILNSMVILCFNTPFYKIGVINVRNALLKAGMPFFILFVYAGAAGANPSVPEPFRSFDANSK